ARVSRLMSLVNYEAVGESSYIFSPLRHFFARPPLHPKLRGGRAKKCRCCTSRRHQRPAICSGFAFGLHSTIRAAALQRFRAVPAPPSGYAAPLLRSGIRGDRGLSRLDRPSCALTRRAPSGIPLQGSDGRRPRVLSGLSIPP